MVRIGAAVKIRSRKFEGRCARHKSFNPAVEGTAGVRGCPRCQLLFEIWQASLQLNGLIRRFDPRFDDLKRPRAAQAREADPRQMSLIAE